MSVRIISDMIADLAALYCDTTDVAFGPVFYGPDAEGRAEAFLDWLRDSGHADARTYSPSGLAALVADWEDNHEAPREEPA